MYFAHLPASYLMVKIVGLFGFSFSLPEMVVIAISGAIPDIDLLLGFALRRGHHRLLTHTPIWMVFIWLIVVVVCDLAGIGMSLTATVLVLCSLLLHLILDEFGWWSYLFGLQRNNCGPQIMWLYPIKKIPDSENEDLKTSSIISYCLKPFPQYFNKYPANRWGEIIITAISVVVFMVSGDIFRVLGDVGLIF